MPGTKRTGDIFTNSPFQGTSLGLGRVPATPGAARRARLARFARLASLAGLAAGACATSGARFPWPARGPAVTATRSDVTTANAASYRRTTSQVLVRKISRPTRASLDYAAYHANFMNADPAPEEGAVGAAAVPSAAHAFAGALAADTLTGSVGATPLTPEERARPLALAPLVELLTAKHVPGADRLEDVTARIRAESWGLPGGPQIVRQTATEAFLHQSAGGGPVEVWIRVELAPWFTGFSGTPDEDGDGFSEIYGRVPVEALGDPRDIVRFIHDEYEGRVLSAAEVKGWAHQLASYWYPSYNTDLVPVQAVWPDDDTETAIRRELGGQRFSNPTVVMRGKPLGKPVYNVFLVEGAADSPPVVKAGGAAGLGGATLKLPRTVPSPAPGPVADAIRAELAAHGGTWPAWKAEVEPLHAALKRRLAAMPKGTKALAGADGFLFFRQSLVYVLGGDLGKQAHDRNPIPVIVQFAKLLTEHGVDFLFVPVPTKVEIFPDLAAGTPADAEARKRAPSTPAGALASFRGKVVNPFERKLLLELGDKGIETVDLLPAFLAAAVADRARAPGASEPLYQAQDTHWSSRGLELAAKLVADRVRRYPWYRDLPADNRAYTTKDAPFARHGDLRSRLPETDQARYAPEALVGHQVVAASGALYEDDPESPVVLLGDSFTGVYELMDCEHAGVSAHLAKEIGYPVDLVMSYGGGPNVRQKLLRRGVDALSSKKLVIWMMTARDLYDFWEGWQPIGKR